MARFRPGRGLLALALVGTALAALAPVSATAAAAAGKTDLKCTEPIDVKADSVDVDYKTNLTQLRNVDISQCDVRVQARHASARGVNFENTRWTFDGDVRIDVENRGSLRSDQAVVDFENNQLARATITGTPAEFEQRQSDTGMAARGHAGEIVYEVGRGTVRLANDAWLKYGSTEVRGCSLVYNIRQENVQTGTEPCDNERVHIRISPGSRSSSGQRNDDAGAPGSAPSTTPQAP